MDFTGPRKRLVDWLRQQLIGPAQPDDKNLVGTSPLNRYPMGVLYPVMPGGEGTDPVRSELWEDPTDETTDEDQTGQTLAQPARKRRYVPPSAVGFSFFIRGRPRLQITVEGTHYKLVSARRDPRGRFRSREYQRTPLVETTLVWVDGVLSPSPDTCLFGVDVQQRPYQDGSILTVTLFNPQQAQGQWHQQRKELMEKSLYEACLTCYVESGKLAEYPRVDKSLLTCEEQELEFQYRDKHIYAVGHGAAVNWTLEADQPPCIQTEFMPAVEVPLVTTDLPGPELEVLGMHFLATKPTNRIVTELQHFVAGYEQWVDSQQITGWGEKEDKTAQRIHDKMKTAVTRMQRGVALLETESLVFESFQLANQAMLNQMRQQDLLQGKGRELQKYRWRPFQLAFLLVVLESTVREDDDFRDVLDLIWFPTGGGKTEAYLGLIVFLIAWRRLQDPETGGGTVALMRYTLRLLTTQQFLRATRIIFALELLRRANPDRLGYQPITVGIWVGGASSPNTFHQAAEQAKEIRDGTPPPNGLVLADCPWCGFNFTSDSYRANIMGFSFLCTNPACPFGGDDPESLPCNVVDEALYQQPPSLLIGTIDKFARLAWESRAGKFFSNGTGNQPPTLVIQDELHLITGPLGSVAGLYEAALDTLLQLRGIRPKYIASTATIRMATDQVRNLYGRELAVFPPPGLSCDDSYFARTDNERPGRLYVGYLAPGLGQQQCLAPLAAALLVAPQELFADQAEREALLEAWWTQVIYHGSLKSVGESHTAYLTEVRDWTRRFSAELGESTDASELDVVSTDNNPDQELFNSRATNPQIAQLTSKSTARENAATFAQLERKLDEEEYLDVVLATNMVSVGLDVSRLALMVVNSQPLTTAEYIQASSRVGRAEVPGLVCVNYYRHQARSLSHYENFRPYHESFYRFVEPTSVTPYTYQVRLRALHAALVIALRHSSDQLSSNAKAGDFDPNDPWIQTVIDTLTERCARAEPQDRAGQTAQHITQLVSQWHDEALRCQEGRQALHYSPKDRGAEGLLCDHEDPDAGLWPTLHSMRNVESTGVLKTT